MASTDKFIFHGKAYETDDNDNPLKLISAATATATQGNTAGVQAEVDSDGSANFEFTLPKGDTGATGPAPTIEIGSVTTGEPGTQASVTITPIEN